MTSKKESLEERMCQSIFYNLSCLKYAVRSTPEFDEVLSNTMFLKSNTKAFIHVTHFLFNILDPKWFKKNFYWPISEKKYENSYRKSSIEFINHIIDEYKLEQEKVQMKFVVHPTGKEFMSVMLDLIMLAIKKIMKQRNMSSERSVNIDKVTEACSNMKLVENQIVNSIKTETKIIKDKTQAIEQLMRSIYSSQLMSFEDFVAAWHDHNKSRWSDIKERNERIESLYKQTEDLVEKAQQMLQPKDFKRFSPDLSIVRDLAEFYESAGMTSESLPDPVTDHAVNFSWLIAQLHLVLPSIVAYVTNFTVDSTTKSEELKVLKQLSFDLNKIEKKIEEFGEKYKKTIPGMVARLKQAKEEQQRLEEENLSPEILAERELKDRIELDKLKVLESPTHYFDTSKECLRNVVIKKNRLAFMGDEELNDDLVNKTKLLRSVKKSKQTKLDETMGPPKLQSRRRIDPMQLLERATTSRGRLDMNSSVRNTGAIPKNTKILTSTLLSPDLRQHGFNISTVSDILKESPIVESPDTSSFESTVRELKHFDMDKTPSVAQARDQETLKSIGKSPRKSEDIFKRPPLINLDNNTLTSSDGERTVKNVTDEAGSIESFSSSVWLVNDENLLNVSDTILKVVDD